jgi:small subunit ribosomal protein S20
MPITKSAIKQMKQNRVKYARNRNYSSRMKSMVKLILDYVQKGELDKANKILPKVVSAIDVAAKKNLIHKNNAAHKKSRIQKALSANVKDVKVKDVKVKAEKQTKETNK